MFHFPKKNEILFHFPNKCGCLLILVYYTILVKTWFIYAGVQTFLGQLGWVAGSRENKVNLASWSWTGAEFGNRVVPLMLASYVVWKCPKSGWWCAGWWVGGWLWDCKPILVFSCGSDQAENLLALSFFQDPNCHLSMSLWVWWSKCNCWVARILQAKIELHRILYWYYSGRSSSSPQEKVMPWEIRVDHI